MWGRGSAKSHVPCHLGVGCPALGGYFTEGVTDCWAVGSLEPILLSWVKNQNWGKIWYILAKQSDLPFLILTTQTNNSQLKKIEGWESFEGLPFRKKSYMFWIVHPFQRTPAFDWRLLNSSAMLGWKKYLESLFSIVKWVIGLLKIESFSPYLHARDKSKIIYLFLYLLIAISSSSFTVI